MAVSLLSSAVYYGIGPNLLGKKAQGTGQYPLGSLFPIVPTLGLRALYIYLVILFSQ